MESSSIVQRQKDLLQPPTFRWDLTYSMHFDVSEHLIAVSGQSIKMHTHKTKFKFLLAHALRLSEDKLNNIRSYNFGRTTDEDLTQLIELLQDPKSKAEVKIIDPHYMSKLAGRVGIFFEQQKLRNPIKGVRNGYVLDIDPIKITLPKEILQLWINRKNDHPN